MGWGEFGKKLARIGQDTKNGVQKVSDSVSISNRINAEKRSLERLYAAIGEATYKAAPDTPAEGLEDEYAAVKVAYANIESYTDQLNHVKGIVYCPTCGKPAAKGDKFCARCGERIQEVPESTGDKVAQDFREAGQEAGKMLRGAADTSGEFVGGIAAKIRNFFSSLGEKIRGLFKKEEVVDAEEIDLAEDFPEAVEGIAETSGEAEAEITEAAKEIAEVSDEAEAEITETTENLRKTDDETLAETLLERAEGLAEDMKQSALDAAGEAEVTSEELEESAEKIVTEELQDAVQEAGNSSGEKEETE